MRLDNWINLDMDPLVAAQIVSLRPALDSLIVRASTEPEQVLDFSPTDVKVSCTLQKPTRTEINFNILCRS